MKKILAILIINFLSSCLALSQASDETSPSASESTKIAVNSIPRDYVIGSEDVLAVNIWKEPEISRTVPVRPDGKITLPLVGDVQAS